MLALLNYFARIDLHKADHIKKIKRPDDTISINYGK